jgi:hypothetical protein
MNTFQSTVSSPRNQRIMFFVALAVLVAGIVFLVIKFAGGSDPTPSAPAKGFKPQIPPKPIDLTKASGGKVKSYAELPSQVKRAIVGFIGPGVLRGDYGASWPYTARTFTHGMNQKKWASIDSRSVIPMPGYTLRHASYTLEEATTKEILVVVRLLPIKPSIGRPIPMRIGLAPYGKGAQQHWLVDYWTPATNEAAVPYNG